MQVLLAVALSAAVTVGIGPSLTDRSDQEPGPAEHTVTVYNPGTEPFTADLHTQSVTGEPGAWIYNDTGWTADVETITVEPGQRHDVTLTGTAPEAVALFVDPVLPGNGQITQETRIAALAWIGQEPPPGVFPEPLSWPLQWLIDHWLAVSLTLGAALAVTFHLRQRRRWSAARHSR